ncbi:GTPase SAR1 family protein [Actinokineospora baliensis]|uniref:hypothetical protein n=1 Tax=Actinokineospora baliensis TaxID=547056 RepID=UPI001958DADB|nr:hypothetical protein [Actinokineospora baliensis]MBM7774326.1 GTPase SAR1 family protein [Actinokineospora baliensis]
MTDELLYRIGLAGPSRVGKSSLVVSLLRDSREQLGGYPLHLTAADLGTERRVAKTTAELDNSLIQGEFRSDALAGNVEAFTFQLRLAAGPKSAGLRIELMDYPGKWFNPRTRPDDSVADWAACKDFIANASVLVVPVEAIVLMEATGTRQRAASKQLLALEEVAKTAEWWATSRGQYRDEPALLLLCPVKCESYFADNLNATDRSTELHEAVRTTYAKVIDTVRDNAPHAEIAYCAVDTIGCVSLVRADWTEEGGQPVIRAKYRVIGDGEEMSFKGIDHLLTLLLRHLVDAQHRALEILAVQRERAAAEAEALAIRNEGLIGNLLLSLSGQRRRRRQLSSDRRGAADSTHRQVEELNEVIKDLAERPLSAKRVNTW